VSSVTSIWKSILGRDLFSRTHAKIASTMSVGRRARRVVAFFSSFFFLTSLLFLATCSLLMKPSVSWTIVDAVNLSSSILAPWLIERGCRKANWLLCWWINVDSAVATGWSTFCVNAGKTSPPFFGCGGLKGRCGPKQWDCWSFQNKSSIVIGLSGCGKRSKWNVKCTPPSTLPLPPSVKLPSEFQTWVTMYSPSYL